MEKLRDWPLKDGLMRWLEYARQFWRWPDYFHEATAPGAVATYTLGCLVAPQMLETHRLFFVSTGGLSDHEEVLYAMQQNPILWSVIFYAARKGGHYVFAVPTLFLDDEKEEPAGAGF